MAELIPSDQGQHLSVARDLAIDMTAWCVYILECADKTYYTGCSAQLKQRISEHNAGRGASYTRFRRPTQLVYFEKIDDKKNAEKREREIKKLSKRNKERLIKYGLGKRVSLAIRIDNGDGSGLRSENESK